MSRAADERQRLIVRAILGALIDHPKWNDKQVAKETGFDTELVAEVREFGLSYPPTEGVVPEPRGEKV